MAKAKILKKTFKKLLKSRIVTGLVGSLLYFYTRLVGRTTRWKTKGIGKFYDCWRKEGSIILIGWHGRAMLYPYFWNKKRPLNALVSLHQDGRLIAGFLEKCGLGTIGGSSNGNAVGSARDLLESLRNDTAICIIPDGPKGPSMKLSKSCLFRPKKAANRFLALPAASKAPKSSAKPGIR